jgi:uncharacterized damage-inducible protein DinB
VQSRTHEHVVCHAARVIDLTRSLRHLAWADVRLFEDLAVLPPEALKSRYAPDAWAVGHLAMHIVGGAEWYAYCLAGTPWTDLQLPESPADLQALARHLAELDSLLLDQAALPDELVEFVDEDGPRSALRSTILAQACLHSAEHRTQIACALEVSGHGGVILDDYDLWAFESVEQRG